MLQQQGVKPPPTAQSIESFLVGADPMSDLVQLVRLAMVSLPGDALREALFIITYLPEQEAQAILRPLLELKMYQQPGSLRRVLDAVKAFSLHEYFGKINLSLGGK